jgi:hypothetical protein
MHIQKKEKYYLHFKMLIVLFFIHSKLYVLRKFKMTNIFERREGVALIVWQINLTPI